jgi:hypothetical protein
MITQPMQMKSGVANLLTCLRIEDRETKITRLQAFSEQEWEKILAAASQYGVVPILFHTLNHVHSDLYIPQAIWTQMKHTYYRSAARNMRLYRELVKILSALNSQGISVILLKGAHLAESVYKNLALRPMVDIDLLAHKEDLLKVHEILLQQGYTCADGRVSGHVHLAPYEKDNAIPIEVHFHITRPPVSQRVNPAALWERAHNNSYQGVDVLTLCPEDLLLHLCYHTCIDHGFSNGFIPYFDIVHILTWYEGRLNWDQLWERGTEWGIEKSVYLMLALTEKLLGFPVPKAIQKKMKPSQEVLGALHTAENLIYERDGEVSPIIARMFGPQGWAATLRSLLRRTFPPRENMSVVWQDSERKKNLTFYWLYVVRLHILLKKHGKTVYMGLRHDPETIRAIRIQNRKNDLRDWLISI